MKPTRLITIFVLLCIALVVYAKKEQEYPHAEIKIGYNYLYKFLRGNDGVAEKNTPFILIANKNQSKFYCPSTEYRDSLLSTPSGRTKERQMFNAAVRAYSDGSDRSAMDGVVYHSRLYVFKDFVKSVSTTYDEAGMGECGYYDEPFSEIDWVIAEDSTKNILNYQCIMATADYHGRKWTVWFTPEIPMQDGPWKFCGLPGLVLEASEPSGQHYFIATGVELCSNPIFPVFNSEYHKMNRLDMLRAARYYKENSNVMFKAATGFELGGGNDAPITEESRKYDYRETDYH